MEAHRDEHTVVLMCRVLNVSKSGYYKWRNRRGVQTDREARRKALCQKIRKSFHQSYGTYGSPRVHQDLEEWGYGVSQKTVARLMKAMGLRATPKEKYKQTTDSNPNLPVYPNRLNRDFQADRPNQVWVADMTSIRTLEGWVYLASVIDLYSRKVVGWHMAANMKKELPLQAFKRAVSRRHPPEGLIHHSDRGSQYCSRDYIKALQASQMVISMSRKGNPYDNACMESFHATLKKDLIYRARFKTRAEAIHAVNHYISRRYNRHRRHSTLGYRSPEAFEEKGTQAI